MRGSESASAGSPAGNTSPAIVVAQLSKQFRTYKKLPGLGGAVKGLFHRQYELTDAVKDIAFQARTLSKAHERVIELVAEKCAGKSSIRLATLHANAEANARSVLEKASAKLNAVESVLSEVSPAIGTHMGPGTVGLAYCAGFLILLL